MFISEIISDFWLRMQYMYVSPCCFSDDIAAKYENITISKYQEKTIFKYNFPIPS
jgi:hypothetical protein